MSNRELVAAHYAAAERGDLAGMMADFDDDISWVEAAGFPLGGEYRGRDEITACVFAAIAASWDGFGMRVDELHESGDTVIAVGRYLGAHRGTGRRLDARAVHIWRVEAGRIVAFEQLTDTKLVAEAARKDDE